MLSPHGVYGRLASQLRVQQGIGAGVVTFVLGPPLGGFILALAVTIVLIVQYLTGSLPGDLPLTTLITFPILVAYDVFLYSFITAWAPAAVAAVYVTFRIGFTGRFW